MKSQQKLSPQKYIETKARSLPIYKCLVNDNWEASKMADVIVMRSHVNGNITAGIYLVDLLCLGIKDSFYIFNTLEDELNEELQIGSLNLIEIDYDVAHNIIYAGHDFAADYEINPAKGFAVTRYILEEDNDSIPLIDIATGDDKGKPMLMVDASYNYGPALAKLKKNAGEGNYTFFIQDEEIDQDEDEDYDEEDDDIDVEFLAGILPDFIDFNYTVDATDDELEDESANPERTLADVTIINVELMMRSLEETLPLQLMTREEVVASADYKMFEETTPLHKAAFEESEELIGELYGELGNYTREEMMLKKDNENSKFYQLFEKYRANEMTGFAMLNVAPMSETVIHIELLQKNIQQYLPLEQLVIAAFTLGFQKKYPEGFPVCTNFSNVIEVFPGNQNLHSMHHKIFWLVKAIDAINHKNREQLFHYHSLFTVTGIGGQLKHAYALHLGEWFEKSSTLE